MNAVVLGKVNNVIKNLVNPLKVKPFTFVVNDKRLLYGGIELLNIKGKGFLHEAVIDSFRPENVPAGGVNLGFNVYIDDVLVFKGSLSSYAGSNTGTGIKNKLSVAYIGGSTLKSAVAFARVSSELFNLVGYPYTGGNEREVAIVKKPIPFNTSLRVTVSTSINSTRDSYSFSAMVNYSLIEE